MSAPVFFTKGFPYFAPRALFALFVLSWSGLMHAADVRLTWSDNSDNEDGFNIERAIGDGTFERIAQVASNAASYVDTGAEAGVQYSYRVNAFNAFGESGYTNVAAHYINIAPSISELDTVVVDENEVASGLLFTVEDFETDAADLVVEVLSSNLDLVDPDGISLGGAGIERLLALTPKRNASGSSTITVSASDGEDVSVSEFLFTVNPFQFPGLELGLETLGAGPRAGEAFLLSATVSSPELVESVSYYVEGALLGTSTSAPFEVPASLPEAGQAEISAVAKVQNREETVSDVLAVTVGAAPSSADLIANLREAGADGEAEGGHASYDLATDRFRLDNEGGVIAGATDSSRFYFLRVEGDFSMSARVAELEASSVDGVAGLMLRSTMLGRAAQTSLLRDSEGSLEVRTRQVRGGSTEVSAGLGLVTGDSWLRVDREGSEIRYFFRESSGVEWTLLGEESILLGATVFVGFTVAGGEGEGLATAYFTQANIEGEILPFGSDAVKPEIPSRLTIVGSVE